MTFEVNNHEEADTLMICLAASASQRSPGAQLVFFSPDTDVLVLAVANYDQLCKNTSISMVSGTLEIAPIWRALGQEKAKALPIFHAFSGADNVGRFSGLGKTNWFQQYLKAGMETISALMHTISECERNAGQLCVHDVLPEGCPHKQHSRPEMAPVLQELGGESQVAPNNWCTAGAR